MSNRYSVFNINTDLIMITLKSTLPILFYVYLSNQQRQLSWSVMKLIRSGRYKFNMRRTILYLTLRESRRSSFQIITYPSACLIFVFQPTLLLSFISIEWTWIIPLIQRISQLHHSKLEWMIVKRNKIAQAEY